MALPQINDRLTTNHTLTLDDDLTVTFQLAAIPGSAYNRILDDYRDPDGNATHEEVAEAMLAAGIRAVYSSEQSTPAEFTDADAKELWNDWPEWARWSVYRAVIAYSTKGPVADPFDRSNQNANGDE